MRRGALVVAMVALALPLASSGRQLTDTWTGTWATSWDGGVSGSSTMKLIQRGSIVTGTYTHDSGRIRGTLAGDILTGTWDEAPTRKPPSDAGDFEFRLAKSGKAWQGKWGYGAQAFRGRWDGRCESGACLENGDDDANPGTATFLLAARQFFTEGGDVTVSASAKLKSNKRCRKNVPSCTLDLTPRGNYFGLFTQEDDDFRVRFRITGVRAVRSGQGLAAYVEAEITDRQGGRTGCEEGGRLKLFARNDAAGKPVRSNVQCYPRSQNQSFRKFTFRLIGNALTG